MVAPSISETLAGLLANTLQFPDEVRYLAGVNSQEFLRICRKMYEQIRHKSVDSGSLSFLKFTSGPWNELSRHPNAEATFHSRQLAVVVRGRLLRL